jgi:hypothetical protein
VAPLVDLGQALRASEPEKLAEVKRLYLALFVNREHQRIVRRIEIKPNDILHFLCKLRIVRELETRVSRAMAIVPKPLPDKSTMRARTASFCGVLPFAMSPSSTVRSLGATYRHASILRIRAWNLICQTGEAYKRVRTPAHAVSDRQKQLRADASYRGEICAQ